MGKREGKRPPKQKTGWYLGLHHIVPSSRAGTNSPTNLYPRELWGEAYSDKHAALHLLFVNRTPKEIIEVIGEYTKEDGNLKESFFATSFRAVFNGQTNDEKRHRGHLTNLFKIKKRKNAWKVLFGSMNGLEAIEWIRREFIYKEWLNAPD